MSIRRVVPNLNSDRFVESREFYVGLLGLQVSMDLGWIMTFASTSNPTAQISIISDDPSGIHPDLSIEVEDVDSIHAAARARGCEIVYPLTDEPWGVRRFFVREPNGQVVNVVSHRGD